VAELGGRLTPEGILLNLAGDELRFPSGTATLPDADLPTLERIAALLEQRPELSARVEGHTDSLGGADINQGLSQQRAEAVMQALVERGIDADRLSAVGLGAERPIADNATEAGRRANRRVEVYVLQ
jgi:outer membrane protein OmpA-like peptidoglycan-associated protein